MDKERALEELKPRLADYLQEKGITVKMGSGGKSRNTFQCLNPAHSDKHASMGIVGDRCNCFSCGAMYDILDLIAMDNGLDASRDFLRVLEIGCNKYGIILDKGGYSMDAGQKQAKNGQGQGWQGKQPAKKQASPITPPTDYTSYYDACTKNLGARNYLASRGITEETAKAFKLGYDFNCRAFGGAEALIIPTSKYSYVSRNLDTKAESNNRYRKTGVSQLFNLQALDAGRPIFIVEGEIDAITIEQAGYKAIALGSTQQVGKLVKYFETTRPSNFLLLALDNDEAGAKAQAELKEGLTQLQLRFYEANIYGACKDANELYLADAQALTDALKQAESTEQAIKDAELEAYRKTFAGNKLLDFCDHIQNASYNPISTGFKSVDDILQGGLYAGLYVIGAISSLGKTTFCLQLADQIAQQGTKAFEEWQEQANKKELWDDSPLPPAPVANDVLIFSLEMSEDEIIAKSLSRCTMLRCAKEYGKGNTRFAKTTRSILTGEKWEHFSEQDFNVLYGAMDDYTKYAQHIKIIEAMGDVGVEQVREITQRHITLTGKSPIVIIDYLQILAPTLDKGTDKQNTDKAVLELKKMSRDFRTPVIAISSFNRENYSEPVGMSSFKESGNLMCHAC